MSNEPRNDLNTLLNPIIKRSSNNNFQYIYRTRFSVASPISTLVYKLEPMLGRGDVYLMRFQIQSRSLISLLGDDGNCLHWWSANFKVQFQVIHKFYLRVFEDMLFQWLSGATSFNWVFCRYLYLVFSSYYL